METVYFYSAVIGGGLLVLQVLMLLLGGSDSDFDADGSPDMDASDVQASTVLFQLSLKTVVAFVTFFGLAGMACIQAEVNTTTTLLVALGAGLFAFVMVGQIMRWMVSLQSKGNLNLASAVGQSAKVDLRIPARHSGTGKVLVVVGGRMKAQKAVTAGDEIPTGAEVRIQKLTAPDTFEVTSIQ